MEFKTFSPTLTQLRVLEDSGAAGNLCAVYRLQGKLDEPGLASAVKTVISRTAPFSYRFLRIDESLKILLSPDAPGGLSLMDVAGSDEAHIYELIKTLCNRAFRLDGGAPYVFCLLKGRDFNYLVFTCHPALIDRYSLKILFTSISTVYNGGGITDELGMSQEQLLASEKDLLRSDRYAESVRFWLRLTRESAFEWRPPRLEADLSDTCFSVGLSAEACASVTGLARELRLDTETLLLFCFHIFLFRLSRNKTVVTSYHHRIRSEAFDRIGFNENKAVLNSLLDPDMTARSFFKLAAGLYSRTQYHADLPAHEMYREMLHVDPNFRRPTNVLFNADTLPYRELTLNGTSATLLPFLSHRLQTEDLAVYFDAGSEMIFHVLTRSPEHNSGMKMAMEHYLALLGHIAGNIDKPLNSIPIFNAASRERALSLADGGPLKSPARDVMEEFAASARSHPEAPAVSCGGRSLTYGELFVSACGVAANLSAVIKGKPEPLVGICLGRSERMVQAIFGTLFSGAAYLPLDPKMPAERLAFIARDAGLTAMITDEDTRGIAERTAECPILQVESLLKNTTPVREGFPVPAPESKAAYVIYTSGTTGKPKGVVLERGMLANLMAALSGVWHRGPGSRWLQFASFNFDASVVEIFNPLAHGAELVLAQEEVRTDPDALFRLMRDRRVTHATFPPAMLPLLPRQPLPELKVVFCGGEAIDEEAARFWSKVVELCNCYGPTEACVMATLNILGGYKASSHLGRPLRGYHTYLLDENSQLAPLGGVGEICIGGASVARGYLGRPDLTAQKFIPNPFGRGRLYRTGDLARFLPNGEMEFLGRNDFQVKIRGFRIELGDVESAISEQPGVKGVYVAVLERQSGKTLTAWYAARTLTSEALRERLAERLPHYMIPSFLVRVNAFPLTNNGKIDRARLPAPDQSAAAGTEAGPLDELEERIRNIWASVLGMKPGEISPENQFFHLGGHSLLAALVCSRINTALGVSVRPKLLFEFPVFADFCERVQSLPKEASPFATLLPTGALSSPVESRLIKLIYSRAVLAPDDNTYNIISRIDFSIGTDPRRLRMALTGLFEENPIFRAAFSEKENQLWVESDRHCPVRVTLSNAAQGQIEKRIQELRAVHLGVGKPPLWRAELYRAVDGRTAFLFCVHHLLFDGWSLNLFIEELGDRYEALAAGKKYVPGKLTWFDYCYWARGLSRSAPYTEAITYWRRKLAGINARVELPVDSHDKKPDSNAFRAVRFEPETVRALKRLADEKGMTLPPLLFSLYLVWLWRLSGQDELVCSYPYAGRDLPGSEDIYGTFVAMGYLRQRVNPEQTFAGLALDVHRQMLDDKENLTAAPYDAEIPGMDSLNVIFSLQTGIMLEGRCGGTSFKAKELPSLTSKGDIAGIFYQATDGAIEGHIEFDSSLFRPGTMEGFVSGLSAIVTAAAKRPDLRVSELPYQSGEERSRFLEFASGPALDTEEISISGRFSEIVRLYPGRTALVFKERTLTYRELDAWSSHIAADLPGDLGTDSLVGLSIHKSALLIAAVLGILKRGCAYVPLDPGYPGERLRYFAGNSGLRRVVADDPSREALEKAGLSGVEYLVPHGEAGAAPAGTPARVPADALAYIIYTSGSTGAPKGVLIENRSVVRMVLAASPGLGISEKSVVSQSASMNFDASVMEMFMPLLNGGTLVVIPEEARRDPARLHKALRENRVTHAFLAAAVLQNLPRAVLPDLKLMGFGGDTLEEGAARWWAAQTRLFSLYGPTETTVMASMGEILPGSDHRTLGRPLPGYRLYLLNSGKQPVPMGAAGEICIGGEGAARGYLARPGLTMDKFVSDPFGTTPYELMYLSGDMGRFRPDGTIEFLGRKDGQVKLRGFRIELGEIESRLAVFAGIRQAVCAVKGEDENKYLAAYYVADTDLDAASMRGRLAAFLPDYMVPSFFMRLPSLPVSPNGKLDRAALPAIHTKACANPPREGLERRIADVWEDVLRFRGVGRDEDFFHLGGNSLLAVRMQAEVKRRLGMDFLLGDFYASPTVKALAAGGGGNHIELAVLDAAAGIEVNAPALPGTLPKGAPRSVLLTGAGGFLGIFLLKELSRSVEKVFCLVRCADEVAGLEALRRQARAAGLEIDFGRVEIIRGDLAAAGLGISSANYDRLAESDAIVHCGAFVHHLHGYPAMKAANVEGTRALLSLALKKKLKPFCYISTLSAGAIIEGADRIAEAVLPNRPVMDSGYILTKWAGEQLVAACARKYGLPAVIARPGNITGRSDTGFTNFAGNHFWLFAKGCLQLGAYPRVPAAVEMLPVDILARAIAGLALSKREGLLVANLSNPATLTQDEFFSGLASCGLVAGAKPAAEWQRLLSSIGEDNALSKIKDLYMGDLTGALPPVERGLTAAALAQSGLVLEADYGVLIPVYVKYLRQAGFLPKRS